MAKQQYIQITDDMLRNRVDVIIAQKQPLLGRGFIKKLAKENKILFNDFPVSSGYKIKNSGTITIDYDIAQLQNIPEIDLEVLFEDDHLLAINKPSGVISHSRGKYWDEPSVASSIRKKLHKANAQDMRAGIIHRLDRATSGVILCAKDSQTSAFIQKQFEKRTIKKIYYAITEYSADIPSTGIIEKPIGRNIRIPSRFKVDANGKYAMTEYSVVAHNEMYMLIKLLPKTGRTHQLRVHLASLGIPIVGDTLYDSEHSATRLMLHAAEITIQYPDKDSELTIKATLPPEFKEYVS